jgi:hypothetical protein
VTHVYDRTETTQAFAALDAGTLDRGALSPT